MTHIYIEKISATVVELVINKCLKQCPIKMILLKSDLQTPPSKKKLTMWTFNLAEYARGLLI